MKIIIKKNHKLITYFTFVILYKKKIAQTTRKQYESLFVRGHTGTKPNLAKYIFKEN